MDDAIDFTRMNRSVPPNDLWPAIAGEMDRRRRRRIVQRFSAVAAMITVVVLATVMVEIPMPMPHLDGDSPAASTTGATLGELRAASARLESRLSDRRQSVVDGVELESLLWLEAELAWLDEQLADAPADRELWRERVVLLTELNRRYADGDWRREMLLASV